MCVCVCVSMCVCTYIHQWILWIYFIKSNIMHTYVHELRTYARMYVSVVFCTIALYHVNTSLASNTVLTQNVWPCCRASLIAWRKVGVGLSIYVGYMYVRTYVPVFPAA